MGEFNRAYELAGRSLDAAIRFDKILEEEFAKTPVAFGRTIGEIQHDHMLVLARVHDRVKREDPDILEILGFEDPVTIVKTYEQGFPRAYHEWPSLHAIFSNKPGYIMFSRVGYDNEAFKPLDAIEVDDADIGGGFGYIFYKGQSVSEGPIYHRSPEGIAMPDLGHVTNPNVWEEGLAGQSRIWRAEGKSKIAVEEFLHNEKQYHDYVSAVMAYVTDLIDDLKDSGAIDEEFIYDELYFNQSLGVDENGDPDLRVSLRSAYSGGEIVPLGDNPFFIATKVEGSNDLAIKPNTATAGGRAFAQVYNAIPKKPSVSDYPDLGWRADGLKATFNDAGHEEDVNFPRIDARDDECYLVYSVDEDTVDQGFAPLDAIEVSQAEFIWLRENERDEQMGITPPPFPPELAHLDQDVGAPRPQAGKPKL